MLKAFRLFPKQRLLIYQNMSSVKRSYFILFCSFSHALLVNSIYLHHCPSYEPQTHVIIFIERYWENAVFGARSSSRNNFYVWKFNSCSEDGAISVIGLFLMLLNMEYWSFFVYVFIVNCVLWWLIRVLYFKLSSLNKLPLHFFISCPHRRILFPFDFFTSCPSYLFFILTFILTFRLNPHLSL